MIIEKKSTLSGKLNVMDISVTVNELAYWKESGHPIQRVFPWLTPDEREFLMTGITPEEWNELDLEE